MIRFVVAALWMAIALAGTVSAQEMTLDALIEATLARNPAIRITEEAVVQKRLALDKERISHTPASVTLSGSASETRPNLLGGVGASGSRWTGTGLTTLTLSKTFYRQKGEMLDASERKALYALQKAELALERKRQLLRKQVQHAWLDLLLEKANRTEDEAALERLHEHARISQVFYEQGRAWKNDLLQSAVKIAQAEKGLIASKNSIRRAEATLNQLMDRTIDAPLGVSGALQRVQTPLAWAQIERLLERQEHPDLGSALLDQQVAAADVTVKKAANAPELALTGSYTQDFDFTQGAPSQEDLALALSLSWTLWDSGSTGKDLAVARSSHLMSGIQLHEKEQAIRLEVRNGWYGLQEAGDQVEVLEQALENARENYRVNQVRYQERLGSANDLLSAQDLLSSSRKDWLSALARYHKARYTLQYELGVNTLDGL